MDITQSGSGLEELKNLACYCCEGTLVINEVADTMNITVDELKTATCQKKGFTGCDDSVNGIKVRTGTPAAPVCALCPFTADAHCKKLTGGGPGGASRGTDRAFSEAALTSLLSLIHY